MKRYLAFAYGSYDALGGWGDFEGDFSLQLDAEAKVREVAKDYGHGSGHVIDTSDLSTVYTYSDR